ncbi:dihydroorotase [Sulfurisphaera ohwakuensis]|uniref:dihydroorotase n=1 Tax=Sulfurisphaera ohwakuensis TaxID=69656 RepID=UPI0036F3E09C
MWIKGKAWFNNSIDTICIQIDRFIKNIKKDCKPDIEFKENQLILPASIDMHVHVRGAQLSYKETVATATSEAAYGGIGLIVDMPNTLPPVNTYERVIERIREFENYSRTDFGIYSGVTKEIEKIDTLPIAGYKIYPEDLDRTETKVLLEKSKKLKVLHPEIPLALKVPRKLRNIWMEIAALHYVQGNVHITHITNYETVKIAKELGFSTDITPHHLLVNGERDCITKVNPPIRDYLTRLGLWRALFEVDTIVSDHAPHSKDEKNLDYDLCPPGIAAVSFTTPFIYSLVFKDLLNIERAVNLLSKNPAKILNIPYGEIRIGYVANFTIISKNDWKYRTKFSKVTETPLDNFPLEAKVEFTIVQGKIAFDGKNVLPIRGVNAFDKSSRYPV